MAHSLVTARKWAAGKMEAPDTAALETMARSRTPKKPMKIRVAAGWTTERSPMVRWLAAWREAVLMKTAGTVVASSGLERVTKERNVGA